MKKTINFFTIILTLCVALVFCVGCDNVDTNLTQVYKPSTGDVIE